MICFSGEVIVVLFTRYNLAMKVIQAAGTLSSPINIKWIGSDGWVGQAMPNDFIKASAVDAIGLTTLAHRTPGFRNYLKGYVILNEVDSY